ncbi:unnamed protein product [Ilex paraguariensis]|uniref:Uncharacterized protein n=1 Tax=Ilex paraguariensis TaxID=185542 RepID=A0ABC8UF15_9AQUA
MRCKKHVTDLSSSVGVCASCLRERLFALIAAQAHKTRVQQEQHVARENYHRKSDTQPPPLIFPRSVSPYISRRKSDNATTWPHHHHHHTPQVGPNGTFVVAKKKKKHRFSFLSSLFRSNSETPDADPRVSVSDFREPYPASSSSPSWFSTMLSGRQKKQSRTFSVDESTVSGYRRTNRTVDRGMSPARYSGEEEEEQCYDRSSGYSSESSQGWKQTPGRTTAAPQVRRGGVRQSHSRNVSGLAFCLSPLVRASPNRHWNQKGMPPEMAVSGELRAPVKPPPSNATSFCKNRSRKLADFGRFNHDH